MYLSRYTVIGFTLQECPRALVPPSPHPLTTHKETLFDTTIKSLLNQHHQQDDNLQLEATGTGTAKTAIGDRSSGGEIGTTLHDNNSSTAVSYAWQQEVTSTAGGKNESRSEKTLFTALADGASSGEPGNSAAPGTAFSSVNPWF